MRKTFLIVLFFSLPGFSKSLETPYLNFSIPDSFECKSEAARYTCKDTAPGKKDALLTMIFKRSGPQDSLSAYTEYLGRPISRMVKSAPPALSKMESVKTTSINGYEWVEAKH